VVEGAPLLRARARSQASDNIRFIFRLVRYGQFLAKVPAKSCEFGHKIGRCELGVAQGHVGLRPPPLIHQSHQVFVGRIAPGRPGMLADVRGDMVERRRQMMERWTALLMAQRF
jgi:hypothetical protein